MIVLLLILIIEAFACDHDDLVQLSYMPGLSPETLFTRTRESKAGSDYCKSTFFKDCLDWCAYDKQCASVHFLLLTSPGQCVCHKSYLLYDQLPSPVEISYGYPCNTMGYAAQLCISLACRENVRRRMIDQVGLEYEEVPLLNTRAWMSSVFMERVTEFGPQSAVDDDLNSQAQHETQHIASDAGYHWIIIELPYQARITHVSVRPISTASLMNQKTADFSQVTFHDNKKVRMVYLINWHILSVSNLAACQQYAKSDYYLMQALTFVFGRYFKKGFMCIVGRNVDPMTFRSSGRLKRLQAVIDQGKARCQLFSNLKPWIDLTECSTRVFNKSYQGVGLNNLEGAELLAAADLSSTPDALFVSGQGRFYQFPSSGRRSRWYNKLISWKHWTVCGQFSTLLSRTTLGVEKLNTNQACRAQQSLYLAIRSTKLLQIMDVRAYYKISSKPAGTISPTYLSFACPPSQYAGFTPEFMSANLRPHQLNISQIGEIYEVFKNTADQMLKSSHGCQVNAGDLRRNFYKILDSKKCAYDQNQINSEHSTHRMKFQNIISMFVKSTHEPDIQEYVLNLLYNLATNFLTDWGGPKTAIRNLMALKLNWTSFMAASFHPDNQLNASLLHRFRRNIYSRRVPADSKLRSDLLYNSHICFISCHWAHQLSALASKAYAMQHVLPLMFGWFVEAFCPDPCATSICKRVKNSENGQCKISQSGLWKNAYECLCKSGYYWSSNLKDCLPQLPCNRPRSSPNYPCSPVNTWYCESRLNKVGENGTEAASNTETICVCKEGFGGIRCERQSDPCRDRHPEFGVSGNFACATFDGLGRCQVSRTNHTVPYWECVCAVERSRDLALAYDNCAAHRNACHSMVCIHGHFISSTVGNLCRCKCNPGYSGKSCSQWTGVWSPWSQWDRCRPECGNDNGNRRSISLRSCINRQVLGNATPHDFCVGEAQRWRDCDSAACWLGGDQLVTKSLRLRAHFLLSSAIAACAAAAVAVWTTYLVCRYKGYNIGPRPPFESVYQQN